MHCEVFETEPCPDVSKVLEPLVWNCLPYDCDGESEYELVGHSLNAQFAGVGKLFEHIWQDGSHHVEE